MLSIGASTKVFLRPGPTDLRLGFEGLYQLVRTKLDQDPLSGHVFAFCNQSKTRLKLLTWDGSGLWLCSKRLEKGRFTWLKPWSWHSWTSTLSPRRILRQKRRLRQCGSYGLKAL